MGRLCNAVLVIHGRGMDWVTDAGSVATWGRMEDSISVGTLADAAAVQAVGEAFLAERSQPQTSTVARVQTIEGSPAPGVDYDLADTLTAGTASGVRVLGLDYRMNGVGGFDVVPQLATKEQEGAREAERRLERMVAEAGGTSGSSATPIDFGTTIRPGKVATRNVREWSWRASDELDETDVDWQPFVAPEPMRLYEWRVDCDNDEATGDSIFEFRVNGVHDGLLNIVIGASETSASVPLYGYEVLVLNDVFRPRCSTNGGHTNGAVQLRAADIV